PGTQRRGTGCLAAADPGPQPGRRGAPLRRRRPGSGPGALAGGGPGGVLLSPGGVAGRQCQLARRPGREPGTGAPPDRGAGRAAGGPAAGAGPETPAGPLGGGGRPADGPERGLGGRAAPPRPEAPAGVDGRRERMREPWALTPATRAAASSA